MKKKFFLAKRLYLDIKIFWKRDTFLTLMQVKFDFEIIFYSLIKNN